MSKHLVGAAALLLALAAPAGAQQSPASRQSNATAMGQTEGNGLAGFLTPEQQAMLTHEAPGGTKTQRAAWHRDQEQKFAHMSETDRIKFKDGLQHRWDALPEKQKDRIKRQLGAQMTQQDNGL
jgi:hypothetical protein